MASLVPCFVLTSSSCESGNPKLRERGKVGQSPAFSASNVVVVLKIIFIGNVTYFSDGLRESIVTYIPPRNVTLAVPMDKDLASVAPFCTAFCIRPTK